jgi:hypothetical protein
MPDKFSQQGNTTVSIEKALEIAHRALQSRLDGYRTSSARFVAALVAFSAAFDAFLFKTGLPAEMSAIGYLLISIIGLIVIGVCVLVILVLKDARKHFSEMSGVIIGIERRAGLFDKARDGTSILPEHWDSKLPNGEPGWPDFAIRACYCIAIFMFVMQILGFAAYIGSGPGHSPLITTCPQKGTK